MKLKRIILPVMALALLFLYGCSDKENTDGADNTNGFSSEDSVMEGEVKAYMLLIDGERVAYLENDEELSELKEALIDEKYAALTENSIEVVRVTVNNTMELEETYVERDEITEVSEIMEHYYDAGGKISFSVTVNETETKYIAFETVYQNSSTYNEGTSVTKTEGVQGEKLLSYEVTYIDGEETARTLVSEKTVKEPINKVVLVGTKKSTASTGSYSWPLSYVYITSPFGRRYLNSTYSNHYGVDLRASTGTTVYAADGGKVIFVGTNGNYGKLVKIQHDNGDVTYYAHLSKIDVSVGDRVYKGQSIAKSGATGRVTGPHLHFEIRKNGVAVDPTKYLPEI